MAEYNPSKIIKDGNTYNFRDTTKIPLAGSNEISGSLIPSTDGTVNLGSSSYQWNNAYIKSLTINGVACGDILTHNANEFANIADVTNKANDSDVVHKSGNEFVSGVKNFNDVVLGEVSGQIRIGNNCEGALFCNLAYDGRIYNNSNQFVPATSSEYNLGTSTNKWKTLNGINPGALSLPSTSVITIDTSDSSIWSLDGTTVVYTPMLDGWLTIIVKCSSVNDYISVMQYGLFNSCSYNSSGYMRVILPVRTGKNVEINAVGASWRYVRLLQCQGNV